MELLRAVNRSVRLLRVLSESATLPDEAWIPAAYLSMLALHLAALAGELDTALTESLPKTGALSEERLSK